MTDEDTKKLENVLKNTMRPLKELVEVLKNKVGRQELYLASTSSDVKSMKDQQSVINEKLDKVQQTADTNIHKLDALWDQTVRLTEDVEKVKEILVSSTKTFKSAEVKVDCNTEDIKKADKRLGEVEDHLGIVPLPELTIVR